MKKSIFFLLCISISAVSFSQSYKMYWGQEIKVKKGISDMDIVAADKSGLYFTEGRVKATFGVGYTTNYKLYKFDKNFSEVFEKDYKRALKGLDFNSIQPLENDLFMFATDYERKGKTFRIYGARIDKQSGELMGEFTELANYQLESKKDDYEVKMTPIDNGKSFLMVSNISGKEKVSLGISILDNAFRKKENTVINLTWTPDEFTLQDVQYTKDHKIVLLGKQFEETQVGKRKRKRFVFKQYKLIIFNNAGVKEKDIILESGDRFVIGGRLIQQADGALLLAGFYSNTSKKDDLNGFFINKVDPLSGQLAVSSFREINSGMLGKNFDDSDSENDDKKSKKDKDKDKKKAKDEDDEDEEDFPNDFIIRSIKINPADQSIIITSEVSTYSVRTYTTSSYNSVTKTTTYETRTIYNFTNRDILVIKSDKEGKIQWLNAIAKSQSESVSSSRTVGPGLNFSSPTLSYFAQGGSMPYYSSYITLLNNNNLIILLNDHSSNNVNPEYGDRVKSIYNFKKSNFYGISIDLATGKMSRKMIASNGDDIVTPRHAYIVDNEVFIPSLRPHMIGKSELKFARLTVK